MSKRTLYIVAAIFIALIVVGLAISARGGSGGSTTSQTSANQDAQIKDLLAANPISNSLPYNGSDFSINYSTLQDSKTKNYNFILYITLKTTSSTSNEDDSPQTVSNVSDTDPGKIKAFNWIRAHGYNPDDYEIVYQRVPVGAQP